MAALDLTTLTLTNPNALITSVTADAVVWDGLPAGTYYAHVVEGVNTSPGFKEVTVL